jgi:hypothetical protein
VGKKESRRSTGYSKASDICGKPQENGSRAASKMAKVKRETKAT